MSEKTKLPPVYPGEMADNKSFVIVVLMGLNVTGRGEDIKVP